MLDPLFKKIFKFGITGGLGTVTNLILFFIFSDLAGFSPNPVSTGCFIICGTQNYFINHLWTFKTENENRKVSFSLWLKFMLSSVLGFFVNILVLNLLLHNFEWSYKVIPQGIGILFGMIFNFTISNFFVFKKD